MFTFPTLTPITQNTFTISAFEGMSRKVGAGEKTLYNTKNMSMGGLPVLSTRLGRKKLFTPQKGEKITGIFGFDKAYMTTSYGGKTRLYYGNDFSSLSRIFTSEDGELVTSMLCIYDNKVCLFNLNIGLEAQTLMVSSITSIDFPTRYVAPTFNDVTVYAGRVIGCVRKQLRACAYDDIGDWDIYAEREDPTLGPYYKTFETKSEFTACTNYKNRAIFFTADEMYELYGNDPTQFKLVKVADVGCVNRFALGEVDGALYFVSKEGVMRYNGTVPVMISDDICNIPKAQNQAYSAALGGSGRTVYVRFEGERENSLYSYNTETKLWAREDDIPAIEVVNYCGNSFLATEDGLWELEKDYFEDSENNDGAHFAWELETQQIHHYCPTKKRSSRLEFYIRQKTPQRVDVYVSYDGCKYKLVRTVLNAKNSAVCVPLERLEFESIQFKFCGSGQAQIHYITNSFSLGGRVI